MDDFYSIVLVLHITAGSLALLCGMLAVLTRKGHRAHRRAGIAYVGAMLVVALTAVLMATMHPNPFLFAVALFSAALALSGWLPARGDQPHWGRVIGVVGLSAAVLLGAVGIWWLLEGDLFGIVALVFALISGRFGWLDVWRTTTRNRTRRIVAHVSAMGGAYIATVSAVSAVNLDMLPPVIRWLWPTLVGIPLIVLAIRRYLQTRSPHTPSA